MDIEAFLKDHNLRNTECRRAVTGLFLEHPHVALSHQDLETELGQKFDRATLYRTLNSFEENNVVHKIMDDQGITKYALCPTECSHNGHGVVDHIHFQCTVCNTTECLDKAATFQLHLPEGYQVKDSNFLLTGTCPKCAQL